MSSSTSAGYSLGAQAVSALECQVIQHGLPVVDNVHLVGQVAFLKRRQGQLDVLRVVFRIQDPFQDCSSAAIPFSGNEKKNVLPLPSSLSAHVSPP